MQNTNFNRNVKKSLAFVQSIFIGPWKIRSFSLISLLMGFYFISLSSVYILDKNTNTIFIAFIMIVLLEMLIRARSTISSNQLPIYWICIDNFRIGITYAIVLEAFKLGS